MHPDISRRCLSCGASVRAGARFCPQCGRGVASGGEEAERKEDYGSFRKASGRAAGSGPGGKAESSSSTQTPARELAEALKAREGRAATAAGASKKSDGDEDHDARSKVAARVKDVRESLRPRVEKVRDEALVVLEESPDDSGLRFILIAVGLFLVFLLFLFLSLVVLG